jgi:sulfoxide reductase heme-binding subunit YedZ
MLVLLGPSYYLRRAIGQRRWVKLHRFTAVAWLGGIAHAIGEGSDAGSAWFALLIASTTVPALAIFAVRHLTTEANA